MATGTIRLCGIYAIRNLKTGMVYVGGSKDVYARWERHRRDLNAKTHHSPKLQLDWVAHGEEAFEFAVLQKLDHPKLIIPAEQHWIDRLIAVANGYNLSPTAGSSRGLKQSAETRAKRSAALMGNKNSLGHRWSPQARAAMSIRRTGLTASDETRAKLSLAASGNKANLGRNFTEEHRAKIGRPGELRPNAKLKEADVRAIRTAVAEGMSGAEAARRYGVCRSAIYDIVARRNWRHVQ